MEWLVWMVAVAILGLAAVAASGRLGEFPATVTDTPQPHVPSGELTGSDLRALRFAVVPRGYSMQQVDELLDRISRQLDHGPDEQFVAAEIESSVEESWPVPSTTWADPHGDQPGLEVEPQPPLTDDPDPMLRHTEDAPVAPIWQAAEVVFADTDTDADTEVPDETTPASGADASDEVVEPVAEPSQVIEPEPSVDAEPDAQAESAATDAESESIEVTHLDDDPAEQTSVDFPSADSVAAGEFPEAVSGGDDAAEQVGSEDAAEVAAEPTAVDPTAVPESEASIEPEPHPTVSTAKPKRESKAKPKAKPSPVVAETEPVVDELEAQIAQIDTAPSSVADYGAALDDLVSKYSFRKVEHWYELPGFDIPAPADRRPSSEPMSDQPGQDSTADEI